jgi:molecular chaperone DnaK (HSP70)
MLTCSKANEEIREPIISPPQVDNNNLNKDSKNPEAGAGAGDSNGNNGASDNSSANNNNSNNNGSGMATEPQFEIKKKRRTRETALKWEGLVSYHFSSQELDAFNSAENNMHANDRLIQDTYERKNELESFIYDIRGKLDNLYLDYVAPSEKTSILQALQGYEEWLYGEGAKSDKGSYESRIDALRNLCDPFIQRQTEFAAIPDVLTEIETTLRGYEQFAVSKVSVGILKNHDHKCCYSIGPEF